MNKILIVEDCEDIVFILKEVLNPALDITFAKDFKEARDALAHIHFDLVVTDFNFPFGNGDQVAKLAREMGTTTVILFSTEMKYTRELYDSVFDKLELKKLAKIIAA